MPPSRSHRRARGISVALAMGAILAADAPAQNAATNFVANKDLVLSTKTPLGDASVTIPAGTAITNIEVQGEMARVWQGPFSATFALADVQPAAAPTPTTESFPADSPAATPASTATPAPEPAATTAPENPAKAPPSDSALPDWVVPASLGALGAYALLTTIALLRVRRRPSASAAPSHAVANAPVIALSPKSKAKPAVVSEGGKAIACPLCGNNIPLEKVSKGRNTCPACQGTFVGE